MFTKTAVFFCLSVVATLATAINPPRTIVADAPSVTTIAQCNTGDAQCCNTAGAANNLPGVAQALGVLGLVLGDPTVTVGLNCIPIEVIGAGQGANCAEQPVCCSNNNFNGLINIGCNPISL